MREHENPHEAALRRRLRDEVAAAAADGHDVAHLAPEPGEPAVVLHRKTNARARRIARASALIALCAVALGFVAAPAGAADPEPDVNALVVTAEIVCTYGPDADGAAWFIGLSYPAPGALDLVVSVPGLPPKAVNLPTGVYGFQMGPLVEDELSEVEVAYGDHKVFVQPGTPDCVHPVPSVAITEECTDPEVGTTVELVLGNEGNADASFSITYVTTSPGDVPVTTTFTRTVDPGGVVTYPFGPMADELAFDLQVDALDDPTTSRSFHTVAQCEPTPVPTSEPEAPTTTVPDPPAPSHDSPVDDALVSGEVLSAGATRAPSLPRTGAGTAVLAGVAVVTLATGVALVAAARRRQAQVTQ